MRSNEKSMHGKLCMWDQQTFFLTDTKVSQMWPNTITGSQRQDHLNVQAMRNEAWEISNIFLFGYGNLTNVIQHNYMLQLLGNLKIHAWEIMHKISKNFFPLCYENLSYGIQHNYARLTLWSPRLYSDSYSYSVSWTHDSQLQQMLYTSNTRLGSSKILLPSNFLLEDAVRGKKYLEKLFIFS